MLVTRPVDQAEPLASRLREAGHEPILCPLIAIEPLRNEPIDLDRYDWLIVTSANGAAELGRRARGQPTRIAAVGEATAAALASVGLGADLVPETSTQDGLLAALPRPAGRVLVAAAEEARPLLAEELAADVISLYRTRALRPSAVPPADVVVLASGSAARAFAALGVDLPAVSIGPQTTAAAQAAGVRVVAEASTQDVDGLVAAVAAAL